jgi:hypothetical protein
MTKSIGLLSTYKSYNLFVRKEIHIFSKNPVHVQIENYPNMKASFKTNEVRLTKDPLIQLCDVSIFTSILTNQSD